MIVQCDQCGTKFRLDDSKVRDSGVKVRCSKCKYIFIVQKEVPREESEFDLVLSGLGSPAPETLKPEPGALLTSGDDSNKPASDDGSAAAGIADEAFAAVEEQPVPEKEFAGDRIFTEEKPADSKGGFVSQETAFDEVSFSAPFNHRAENEEREEGWQHETSDEPVQSCREETVIGTEPSVEKPAEVQSGFEREGGDEESCVAVGESADFDFWSISADPSTSCDMLDQGEKIFGADEAPGVKSTGGGAPDKMVEEFIPDNEGKSSFADSLEKLSAPERETVAVAMGAPGIEGRESGETPSADIPGEEQKAAIVAPVDGSQAVEEELPPLSISSRRRGSSFFPMMVTAISVLFIIALAGTGFYFLNEGPTAFNKIGLGFLAKWAGLEVTEEGGIAIRNPVGTFMLNNGAGEILTINGEAVNNFREPRASIQVKATLFGPKGEVMQQKTIYCGNALSKEQLATLPMDKIEAAMNNQFGDSLSNLGVQPGKGIPFVVVFTSVPKETAEFGIEVVGSTVASQ